MKWEAVILYILNIGCFGFVLWFVKRYLDQMSTKMDNFIEKFNLSEVRNVSTYATREDTKDLWKRVDDHEQRIARMEGRNNGHAN